MRYALGADVAQELADRWLAAHLERRDKENNPGLVKTDDVQEGRNSENGMLCSSFIPTERARATVSPSTLLLLKPTVREEVEAGGAHSGISATCPHALLLLRLRATSPRGPAEI